MSDRIKKIKVKKADGSMTDYIPIGADAENIDTTDGESVQLKLNKKPYYYNTVADMKADTKLKAGDMAITLGYYTANDGGGALYRIRNVTGNDVSNILVIPISETLVAEIVIEQNLYSKQLGLKGDNVTDETLLLNKFYEIQTNAVKILNEGIYLTSDTIFIKGLWRQDSINAQNNGFIQYKFENATIKYNGVENGCSIVFYNMFKQNIDGLSIDRLSTDNYIDFIGCWHCTISNFDIKTLGIHKDLSILNNKSYQTESIMHLKFKSGYVNGQLIIDPGNSYTNSIYFDMVNFNGAGKNYIVKLLGTTSKQQLIFNECDLSYSSQSVFYIPEKQEGLIQNSLSRCSITCISCYFDSNIPIFYNNNQNNVIYNNYNCFLSSTSIQQTENILLEDYMKNTIFSNVSMTSNSLPTMLVNCCNNGNLKNGTQINSIYQIMGTSTTGITKEVVNDNSNQFGYAQRLTFENYEGTRNQYLQSVALPITSPYVIALRLKKISGSCNIQIGYNGQYNKYLNDVIPEGKEIILINNKPQQITEKNTVLEPLIQFENPNNLVLEVYECMIIPGRMVVCGLPLHGNCIIPPINN